MSGHGHVTPNPDGSKARCGGPGLCRQCSQELYAQQPVNALKAHVSISDAEFDAWLKENSGQFRHWLAKDVAREAFKAGMRKGAQAREQINQQFASFANSVENLKRMLDEAGYVE
jgi:hypothetical protein